MDPPLSYKVQPDGIFKEFFVIGIKKLVKIQSHNIQKNFYAT